MAEHLENRPSEFYLSSFLDFSSVLDPGEFPKSTVNATGLNLSSSCKIWGYFYFSLYSSVFHVL